MMAANQAIQTGTNSDKFVNKISDGCLGCRWYVVRCTFMQLSNRLCGIIPLPGEWASLRKSSFK